MLLFLWMMSIIIDTTELQVTLKMSRNAKNSSAKPIIQKYCKVCQDAGKSEAEYRSHFTRELREPNAKVVCPTLLALECRYCYKNGHTVKYCPVLKNKEKDQKRQEASIRRSSVSNAETKPKGKDNSSNIFACLSSETDSEEEIITPQSFVREEFPALCEPVLKRTECVSSNYAAALSKPVAPKVVNFAVPIPAPVTAVKIESKPAPWEPKGTKASMMDWAAWDSDSDEDEDISPPSAPSAYERNSSYYSLAKAQVPIADDDDW